MIARYIAAGLGLFAFTVAVLAGLFAENSVQVTLSRSISALFVFCLIGYVLGAVAQRVVTEHQRLSESEIRSQYRKDLPPDARDGEEGAPEPAVDASAA